MELDYLRAAHPQPFRILGQALKPFSLGHLELLRWLDNAYVNPEAVPTPGDLIQGVFICARTYERALRDLDSPLRDLRIRFWSWSCGKRWPVLEKMRMFRLYIEDGSRYPDLHEASEESRRPGAPLLQRVRIRLMSTLGLTLSQTMNYPWSLALHDYFASMEDEGRSKLLNQEEEDIISEHERLWNLLGKDIENHVQGN